VASGLRAAASGRLLQQYHRVRCVVWRLKSRGAREALVQLGPALQRDRPTSVKRAGRVAALVRQAAAHDEEKVGRDGRARQHRVQVRRHIAPHSSSELGIHGRDVGLVGIRPRYGCGVAAAGWAPRPRRARIIPLGRQAPDAATVATGHRRRIQHDVAAHAAAVPVVGVDASRRAKRGLRGASAHGGGRSPGGPSCLARAVRRVRRLRRESGSACTLPLGSFTCCNVHSG
jgi:hypothetical protein